MYLVAGGLLGLLAWSLCEHQHIDGPAARKMGPRLTDSDAMAILAQAVRLKDRDPRTDQKRLADLAADLVRRAGRL